MILVAAIGLPSCAGPGGPVCSLATESIGESPVVLDGDFAILVYSHEPAGETSFLLSDVPAEDLIAGRIDECQVMHLELLWQPLAGATPMDATATNFSIRHVIISGAEVGVYSGAGFAMSQGTPGATKLGIVLRDTTVRLQESTDGFIDRLSPARLTGRFVATLDPESTRKLQIAISQVVTNALGRSEFVLADDQPPLISPIRTRR